MILANMMHIACYCTVWLQDLVIKSITVFWSKGHIDQNEMFFFAFLLCFSLLINLALHAVVVVVGSVMNCCCFFTLAKCRLNVTLNEKAIVAPVIASLNVIWLKNIVSQCMSNAYGLQKVIILHLNSLHCESTTVKESFSIMPFTEHWNHCRFPEKWQHINKLQFALVY